MPAHMMDDCWHSANNKGSNLFIDYATVADTLGVYTTNDYANIVDHLVQRWDVQNRVVKSGGLQGGIPSGWVGGGGGLRVLLEPLGRFRPDRTCVS